MKHVLTIAGSDSSGGAGIQADLKAFSAWGVYGMSVLTALTAQNTQGVLGAWDVSPAFVRDQLDAVFHDIRVDAVKIGMLANAGIIEVVADFLSSNDVPIVVLDPVMLSKSGFSLLSPEAESSLKKLLLPLADVVTPNLPEAAALTGIEATTTEQMIDAGKRLLDLGAGAAVVKGGHRIDDAKDVLVQKSGHRLYPGVRISTRNTHGTGCSLSSALTALLARGLSLEDAYGRAKAYVAEGILHGLSVGKGWGPIHHFWDLYGGEENAL